MVYVLMSREVVAELDTWSRPVQVMVVKHGNEWEIIARTHTCPDAQSVTKDESTSS
jgi:hypothetical protein